MTRMAGVATIFGAVAGIIVVSLGAQVHRWELLIAYVSVIAWVAIAMILAEEEW